jgi:TrpR family trp operon transcriptional repressor
MDRPAPPQDLLDVLADLRDPADIATLFEDLLTPGEVANIDERWELVKLLAAGLPQRAVAQRLGAGVATVSRGARILKYGSGGFEMAFDRLVSLGRPDPRGDR